MSSVDLSDPHISNAYNALLQNDPLRWFLLAYGNKPNELSLCASGTGDVEELRSLLQVSPGNVYYGIFRERTQDKSLHVSLHYIPDSVRGVWRARALVHGKAVSSKFQAHQVLNASNPDQITVQALRSLLRLPPRDPQSASEATSLRLPKPRSASLRRNPLSDGRSPSLFTSPNAINLPNQTGSAILQKAPARSTTLLLTSLPSSSRPLLDSGSASPTHNHDDTTSHSTPSDPSTSYRSPPSALAKTTAPDQPHSITTPIQQSPVIISPTFGLHKVQNPQTPPHTSWLDEQYSSIPPPVPEKSHSESQHENQTLIDRGSENSDGRPPWLQMESIPDSQSVASDASSARAVSPALPAPTPSQPLADSSSPLPPHRKAAIDGLPGPALSSPPHTAGEEEGFRSRSKWAEQPNSVESPATREDTTDHLVPKRTYSRFHARAAVAGGADEEEERKLAVLEEERRRRATERAKREKEVREEEEMREREFEARKEREKKRRLESAKKAEEQRAEQKRQKAEDERRRKEEKERKEEEARQRRSHIQQRFEKQKGMDLLAGFVTLESSSSWKRRYFRLSTEDWVFFKNDKEITLPVHAIELSRVRALREWHEGYEELEAIPHSFAVEIKDDEPWLFFADSAEDKEVLLGLLNQAAGL